MIAITLEEDDILRIRAIVIDRDEKEALAFIRDRLMREVERRNAGKMQNSLDGGKGSTL